jgi:hypothetical protein
LISLFVFFVLFVETSLCFLVFVLFVVDTFMQYVLFLVSLLFFVVLCLGSSLLLFCVLFVVSLCGFLFVLFVLFVLLLVFLPSPGSLRLSLVVVLFMSYVFPCGLSLCLFVLDLSSVSLFVC